MSTTPSSFLSEINETLASLERPYLIGFEILLVLLSVLITVIAYRRLEDDGNQNHPICMMAYTMNLILQLFIIFLLLMDKLKNVRLPMLIFLIAQLLLFVFYRLKPVDLFSMDLDSIKISALLIVPTLMLAFGLLAYAYNIRFNGG